MLERIAIGLVLAFLTLPSYSMADSAKLGPDNDTRPGYVCAWFAKRAGHQVVGYYEEVMKIKDRVLVGVQIQGGQRVNCVMRLEKSRFSLIQLTQPFMPR